MRFINAIPPATARFQITPDTMLCDDESFDFPLPAPSEFDADDDIHVKVHPLSKLPQQYQERRDYSSDDEGSLYKLTLRYDRLA